MISAKRLFSGVNIACIRGGRVLFQNLSFGMNPGDIIHLSGPNGAGKTSLLRIMGGALPARGEIEWNGKDFLENHAARFSFLPADDRSLKMQETVFETLAFWAQFWNVGDTACFAAMDKMHLSNLQETPVRYLSAGQKRRLSLARVFLKKSPLWLLDEPLNGLDRESHDLFTKALDIHCGTGGMAAIASHHALDPPKHGSLHSLPIPLPQESARECLP